MGMGYNILSCG